MTENMSNHADYFHFSRAQSAVRDKVTAAYRLPEEQALAYVLEHGEMTAAEKQGARDLAEKLVREVRASRRKAGGVDALMQEFSLSSEEGVALMCLAEALLRIPDNATRDKLIADKLSGGDWKRHLNHSPSLFVNAAAWGLLITGKLTQPKALSGALTRVLAKGGEPLIRRGVDYAMRLLGKQFVTGQNIEEALANGKAREKRGYLFSFDMLGEAALTEEDAARYFKDYERAIHAIGKDAGGAGVYAGNGISVKLSAIHPRYSRQQLPRVMDELLPRLKQLFLLAKKYDIGLNIDAEEAGRLEISLDLLEALLADPDLAGFNGIGFVVQAYQKRCPFVIDEIIERARKHGRKIMIRLVKGAYWDSEIKWAQTDGLADYPVYTRKVHTDVSYLACARRLLAAQDCVYPQFATHNAYTLAAVYQMGQGKEYEFQCLHGMGETLYDQVAGSEHLGRRVRIYAPVGTHETLLAYLVRRLLENGANSSFVNQIVDENVDIAQLVQCPLERARASAGRALPLPAEILGSRQNSRGLDFTNEHTLAWLEREMNANSAAYHAAPITACAVKTRVAVPVKNPADPDDSAGTAAFIAPESVPDVIACAKAAESAWQAVVPFERAKILRRTADLFEENTPAFMALAVREAGKTLANAIAEVREAVDFCRYYADEAERVMGSRQALGTAAVISPWNFPLAIFTGETAAALAAGNTVVAKPAEQTSLIAHLAVTLMHQAGVPKDALQLVLGAGDVGAALCADARINAVIFTGSTEVAQHINRQLAARADNPVLIAETGGMNAMIVDSTALPEQVCADVLQSAFDSAGQRCSALRILCLQEDIADSMLAMIRRAMDELTVGNPKDLAADVGPVIDDEAKENLEKHIARISKLAKNQHALHTPAAGSFVAPVLFELEDLDAVTEEVFGPVLHAVRYNSADLAALIEKINAKGYALTHGIHSRIDSAAADICTRIEAGNIYINRNIVGAVVGVQPFGGHGKSGTGPKAGGPFYLQRLSTGGAWQLPENITRKAGALPLLNAFEAMLAEMPFTGDERKALQQTVENSRQKSLLHASVLLAGPTGERNTLSWKPCRPVWLYGGSLFEAVKAAAALAGSGIQTAAAANHPLAMWAEHSGGCVTVQEQPAAGAPVAALEPLPVSLKQELANAKGALHKIIDASEGLDASQFMQEVSISNNTAAAGGNASLMASAQ